MTYSMIQIGRFIRPSASRSMTSLKALARDQLGTVGSGNHFVDLFEEAATGRVWIANHFGSRGFGHKTASGFLNLAASREFLGKAPGEKMDQPPVLLDIDSELGDCTTVPCE